MPVTQSGTRWKKNGADTNLTVTVRMPSQVERCQSLHSIIWTHGLSDPNLGAKVFSMGIRAMSLC